MRLVLDTNVFVSAVLKVNSLPFLVVRWVDQHGGLLKSAETECQLIEVLARPHIAAIAIPSFRDDLVKLLARAELVTITERIAACRDPTDDKFLELAVNGHADLIVSGDADLLVPGPVLRHSDCHTGRVRAGRTAVIRKKSPNHLPILSYRRKPVSVA